MDWPEDMDRAEVVGGVPDAPQADVMGDFGVTIFETVGFYC